MRGKGPASISNAASKNGKEHLQSAYHVYGTPVENVRYLDVRTYSMSISGTLISRR